ncbi:hypothetical protein ACM46_14750 [Chryseobacterium angstadtii]|uniref:Uncharacterized protein n=1 Tax=Chryseobacterium angstadtii TaxID=558151 RepID=A0A0J7IBC5_9FLAO|nr:hypothetical protein [Chryseobacterium angstadtii]KMQ63189.1 hypothetical protein ACM46_14750 [Chryseobacterium angstadtii]
MTGEEFEKFLARKEIYVQNSRTQSSDEDVLQLYSYILEHENRDSDWWSECHGTDDVIRIIQNSGEDIFEKIKEDIPNWSGFQTELLALSLISSYEDDYKVNERMKLYLELFDIQKHDCDLYLIFDQLHINLKLADREVLERLAKKLSFSSVEDLMQFVYP